MQCERRARSESSCPKGGVVRPGIYSFLGQVSSVSGYKLVAEKKLFALQYRQSIKRKCMSDDVSTGNIGGVPRRSRAKRKVVDVSPWFNPDRVLAEVLKIVNTRIGEDRYWSALSLGTYVYIKPHAFWDAIGRSGNWCPDLLAASLYGQAKDDIMYTVVRKLAERPSTVATEFVRVKEGYYGAPFIHVAKDDKMPNTNLYLTPFRVEAFGNWLKIGRDIERRKDNWMKNTLKITPKQLSKWLPKR